MSTFTDDWQEDEDVNWNDIYVDDKFVPSDDTTHHRREFCTVEDACNKQ